jgi:hypothetical protein
MNDKAYLDPLKDFFLQENHALDVQNKNLLQQVRRLKRQLLVSTNQVASRNHLLSRIQDRYEVMQRHFEAQLRLQRILVVVNNSLHVFRRNADGVFEQVPDTPDSSDVESAPTTEEDPVDIARRLGFETDSEDEIEDDLMRRLLSDNEDLDV